MLTTQQAADKIVDFDAQLDLSQRNIGQIRDKVGTVVDALDIFQRAIDKVVDLRNDVRNFGNDLNTMKTVLKIMDKVGPLKGVAKIGREIVDDVQDVTKNLENKLNGVVNKLQSNPIVTTAKRVQTEFESVDNVLADVQGEIAEQQANFGQVVDFVAKAATFAEEPIQLTGALVDTPLQAITAINQQYADAKALVDGFSADVPQGDFDIILSVERAISKITDAVEFLSEPLKEVRKILKPIEPIINAVDSVTAIIDGAVKKIEKAVGIDEIIDAAKAKVTSFLPSFNALDSFEAAFDKASLAINNFDTGAAPFDGMYDSDGNGSLDLPDPSGVKDWAKDKLERKLLEVAGELIGSVSAQGVGIGIEIAPPNRGSDFDDELTAEVPNLGTDINDIILLGDFNNNTITAKGGENVLMGFEGDDTLIGGTGDDVAVFFGDIGQYVFSRQNDSDPVFIEHISPIPGASLDGRDTLSNIERVTFLGGSTGQGVTLTMDQLFGQVVIASAGDSVSESASTDDLFLFANGTSGVVTTLEGGSGNDLISGSESSDHLIGNAGNDTFRTNGGVDTVNGGAGIDTLALYDDFGNNGDFFIDLADGEFVENGQNKATLIGIENVLIDDRRTVLILGDANGNALTSSEELDLIDGRGGNDTISGGARGDYLIGGDGIDTLQGGADGDNLYVADKAVAGGGQYYDGGEGQDRVIYSSNTSAMNRAEFTNTTANGNVYTLVKDQVSSDAVHIYAGDGRVDRLSASGTAIIAQDIVENVEVYEGSDFDDVIYGGDSEQFANGLAGAAGNDTIYAEYTSAPFFGNAFVDGGTGNDTIIAGYNPDQNPGISTSYSGGGGLLDTLDLSKVEGLRWSVEDSFSPALDRLRGYIADDDNASSTSHVTSGSVEGFDRFIGSQYEDDFLLEIRNSTVTVLAGDGDDTIDAESSNGSDYIIAGQNGDDIVEFNGSGTVFGSAGADEVTLNYLSGNTNPEQKGDLGSGDDILFVRDTPNDPNFDINVFYGGTGRDIISAYNTSPDRELVVDLAAGTVTDFGDPQTAVSVSGFEDVIGSNVHRDVLGGDESANILIGGGGNDQLEGRGGGATNTFYSVAHDPAISPAGEWTLEAVIQTEDDGSTFQRIISKPQGGSQAFSLAVVDGYLHARFDSVSDGPISIQNSNAIAFLADGQQHHVAVVRGASKMEIYLDGQFLAVRGNLSGVTEITSTQDLTIGNFSEAFDQPFNGEIFEAHVWDRALSTGEINDHAINGISNPPSQQGLQLSVTFDENGVGTDNSQNGFTVTNVRPSGDDLLFGGMNNDVLYGGDGDDLLNGGPGTNTLDGGQGTDTASFSFAAPGHDRGAVNTDGVIFAGINANLTTGSATKSGENSTLIRIENLEGTALDDTLTGDDGDNVLSGDLGNDTINGEGGDDTIILDGDDLAYGGSGLDEFILGPGNVSIDGGAGQDLLDTRGAIQVVLDLGAQAFFSEFLVDVPVWADTGTTEARALGGTSVFFTPQTVLETDPAFQNSSDDKVFDVSGEANLQIELVEQQQSFRGTYTDVSAFTQVWLGQLVATNGNDTLTASSAPDSFNGGTGIDLVSYEYSDENVVIALSNGFASGKFADGDTFASIEGIKGTEFNDNLSDASGHETLLGEGGRDAIAISAGNDSVEGGANDDIVKLEVSDLTDFDLIDGGTGNDEISFRNLQKAVWVQLDFGNPAGEVWTQDATNLTGGTWRAIADIENIEDITGSAFGDYLQGDAGNNTISGLGGNDTIFGADGDDLLEMDQDQASLYGGDGNDTLQFYVLNSTSFGIFDGGDDTDTLQSISGIGTNLWIDLDYADPTAEFWTTGADPLSSGNFRVAGDLNGIENVTTSLGDDFIDGDDNANTLDGSDGSDNVKGDLGDDVLKLSTRGTSDFDRLEGGVGNDTADFAGLSTAVWINMAYVDQTREVWTRGGTDVAAGTWQEIANLDTVESLSGTEWSDFLRGDAGSNTISGAAGNDELVGALGNDTLDGGAGNDLLKLFNTRTSDFDVLDGGAGLDTADFRFLDRAIWVDLTYFDQSQTVWTRDSMDLSSGTWRPLADLNNIETIKGTNLDDFLRGDDGSSTILGEDGDDILEGRGGNDTLEGGSGDDTSRGGEGEDTFILKIQAGDFDTAFGGAGNDTIDFSSANVAVWVDLDYSDSTREIWTQDRQDLTANTWRAIGNADDIENLTGSNYGDDLRGDAAANTIDAGLGSDNVSGDAGDDVLVISSSTAPASGAPGDFDTAVGGSGNDLLDLSAFDAAVWVDLGYSDAAREVWTRDTADLDSGTWRSFADVDEIESVSGSRFDDYLRGDGFANTLTGADGDDILRGGPGSDGLFGGSGNDSLILSASAAGDLDVMNGGDDVDLADFSGFASAVWVNMQFTSGPGEVWTRDTATTETGAWRTIADLDSIENIHGSVFSDVLIGDAADNTLTGNGGGDDYSGGDGTDLFVIGNMTGNGSISDFDAMSEQIDFRSNGEITDYFDMIANHIRADATSGVAEIYTSTGEVELTGYVLTDFDLGGSLGEERFIFDA